MSARKAHTYEPEKRLTWQERLTDKSKIPLDITFVESLLLTARNNEREVEDLWGMWQEYADRCAGYDQSATFREFCSWNKLAGAGPLA